MNSRTEPASYVVALYTNCSPELDPLVDKLVKEYRAQTGTFYRLFLGTPFLLFTLPITDVLMLPIVCLLNDTYLLGLHAL